MQAERAQEHTQSLTAQPGVAGCSRNPSPNTSTHTAHACQEWLGHRAPVPGVAGCKQSAHTSTHTAQHPSQEWRGAAETRAQIHTPTPRTRARSGWVTAHPCQEWLGASGARTRAHIQPNTPARSGRAQPKREPKYTYPHRAPVPGVAGSPRTRARSGWVQAEPAHEHTHSPTPQPGVAGRSLNPSPNTQTHTAHPSQEWRGASGERTRGHTQPNSPARSGGAQPKPEPKHTHPSHTPQPGEAGYRRSKHTSTHTPEHPNQEWRGAAGTRMQPHTPTPRTCARSGRVQAERTHKRTHPRKPQPGVAGRSRSPNPTTTQTRTQAPRNVRKPSVNSPGTEAARAMQVTRPNEIRRPGVRLHPKACAALGLEAERATPKHLGTPVPRTCMHALGTGYARKSGEPLGFCPKEGTSASTGAHPPGMTSSHAGGDQPSRCYPGPLCWGPPVRSSGM